MSARVLSVFLKRSADPQGDAVWGLGACTFPLDLSSLPQYTNIFSCNLPHKNCVSVFGRKTLIPGANTKNNYCTNTPVRLAVPPYTVLDPFSLCNKALSTSFEKTCKHRLRDCFFKVWSLLSLVQRTETRRGWLTPLVNKGLPPCARSHLVTKNQLLFFFSFSENIFLHVGLEKVSAKTSFFTKTLREDFAEFWLKISSRKVCAVPPCRI